MTDLPPMRDPAERKISKEELAKHSGDGDLWVSIQGKVYDVSTWASRHPGGDLPLKTFAGQPDSTDAFLAFHPPRAFAFLPKFLIGTLQEDDQQHLHPLTEDHQKVLRLLADSGLLDIPYTAYCKILAVILILLTATFAGVVWSSSVLVHFLSAISLGIVWSQAGWIGHDTGHTGITGRRQTDEYAGMLVGSVLTGIGMGWWNRNHNAHHYSCNSLEHDPDLQYIPIFAVSARLFSSLHSYFYDRRMTFDGFARFMVAHQHLTFYLVMAVARVNLYAQSILVALFGRNLRRRGMEICALCFFWIWFLCLLSYLPSYWERAGFVLVALATTGIQHVQFCINHFSSPVYVGRPAGDYRWLQAQCTGTLNVRCSKRWDWFHGGLHYQIEHHLFPKLPRHNLRTASERFIKPLLIDKHKLPYVSVSFWQANVMIISTLRAAAIQARDLSRPLPEKSLLWEAVNAHG